MIPYYSADQSLVVTDNPQQSDKNREKKIIRFIEKSVIATHFIHLF